MRKRTRLAFLTSTIAVSAVSAVFFLISCSSPMMDADLFLQSLETEVTEANALITTVAANNSVPDVPDTDAPAVRFVNPSADGFVSGILLVAGIADDDSAIVSVETRVDEGEWEPVAEPGHYWDRTLNTSLIAEGPHTLDARAADSEGNMSAGTSITFNVDRDVPELTFTEPVHGEYIRGSEMTITGTAADDNFLTSVSIIPDEGGVFYPTDGPPDNWSYVFDTMAVADGALVIVAEAIDNANNRRTESIAVTVDNTQPEVAITAPADGATISSGPVTVEGTASDVLGLAQVDVKVDGGPLQQANLNTDTGGWSINIDTSAFLPGPHTVEAIATDIAGNNSSVSAPEEITFYYDTTPPAVVISAPGADTYHNGAALEISGTVSNLTTSDSLEISVDDSTYTPVDTFTAALDWSHSLDISGAGDGPLTVYLRAADAETGAWDTESIPVYIDNTAPGGSIDSPAADSDVSGTVQITGTASDGMGLASENGVRITVTDDDDSTAPVEADITSTLNNGQWSYSWDSAGFTDLCTISLTVTDKAGNSSTADRSVNKDTNAPSGTITTPESGDLVDSAGFTVEGTATDSLGVTLVEVKIGSLAWGTAADTSGADTYASWTYAADTSGLPDGNHDLYVRITNGNTATTTIKIVIEVDNTPPEVTITYPTDANRGDDFLYGTVAAAGTASDANLDSVSVQVDGGASAAADGTDSWSYSWDTAAYPAAQNGTVLTVTATDLAGNTGSAGVTVDVRPKITGISPDSALLGETVTVEGYNFSQGLPNFDVLFPGESGTVSGTADAGTFTSFAVPIPGTAVSGDVYVEEGDPVISSNGYSLHVWQQFTGGAGGKTDQALTMSGTGRYQVFYYQTGGTKTLEFSRNGGAFVQLGGDRGLYPSIAVDGLYVYAAYVDTPNSDLVFRMSDNGGADFTAANTVLVGGTAEEADTSIAVFPNADPALNTLGVLCKSGGTVTYIESADNGATWSAPETVDGGSETGLHADLSFDSGGNPYIAYYDETNRKAKFAYTTEAGWQTSFIETNSFQGEYISIAVDDVDGVHVSYYDGMSGDLKYGYAAAAGESFTTTTVDDYGITGFNTDITLDGSGNPLISYINYNYSTVQHAYFDGSAWRIVDSPGSAAPAEFTETSIDIGSDGYAYIGYIDASGAQVLQYRR